MTAQLRTQAEQALEQLKDTIFDYIKSKPQGVTSTDVVKDLNL
ncbi:hypothetical protein [Hymenobacter edaphi]|nr:hypothetical protein [Hymenobacter edaphi]